MLGAAASVAELLADRPDGVLRAARYVPELLIDGHGGHLTAAAASVPVLLIEGHDGVIGAPSTVEFFFIKKKKSIQTHARHWKETDEEFTHEILLLKPSLGYHLLPYLRMCWLTALVPLLCLLTTLCLPS